MRFNFRLFMENAGCLIIIIASIIGIIAITCLAAQYLPAWFMNTGLFVIAGVTISLIILEIISRSIK
jgi:hypothetical protein